MEDEVRDKLGAIKEEEDESSSPTKEVERAKEYDPFQVYHQVIYTGRKHAELKVVPRAAATAHCMCFASASWGSVWVHPWTHNSFGPQF